MRNDKFAFRKRFLRLNNEQRIRIGCLGKTEIRNKCDFFADAGMVFQKVITAEFDLRNQIQLILKEQVVNLFAGCTLSVQHKDRVVQKFFERNLLSF